MDDPFRTYERVNKLINSHDEAFEFDCTTKQSKAIQAAFATKKNVAYAVGGEESVYDNPFSSRFEDKWVSFLLAGNDGNHKVKTAGRDDEPARKVAKTNGGNCVSSLQEIAIKSIIKEGKVPVDALLELASPAPFGKGNETVFDKEVRNAFEIKADCIPEALFPHEVPGNNGRIKQAIEDAMKWKKDAKWTYKLYKMQIYGPGGFFLPHTDTIHAANHIATVIVGLPTEFEGGELVVTHQDQESTFALSNGNAEKTTFCAFFTDCIHEVKEVTSGYRIVLQYDVYGEGYVEEGKDSDSESCSDEEENKIGEIIEKWCWPRYQKPCGKAFYNKNDGKEDPVELPILDYFSKKNLGKAENVALLLQHRYPLGSLGAKILKGSDAKVYDIFVSGGRWKCFLQGLILTANTDYEGKWRGDDFRIVPVVLKSNGDIDYDSEYPFEKTYLMMYSNAEKPPGQLLSNDRYIEHTGNEAQEGQFAYYACCLILSPANNVECSSEADAKETG